ncbi:MAG: ABC transporter permease [Pseudomonadota bacterium]|nr:ABC transporter permease [Pseudomonadota bacterium]
MSALSELPWSGMIGLLLVVLWLVLATFGPMAAPYHPGAFVGPDVFMPFSRQFPLGTDYLGRDVLSRLLFGARYTVWLALTAALIASFAGNALALTAAVSPRWLDELMSRFMDALISIPSTIFALVMVAAFDSSLSMLLTIAAVTYIPGAYRIARSLAVNLNQMEYVEVARARGERRFYIACVEIFPNMLHPMLADFGLRFVFIVLLLSGLSFLGLGIQPPAADLGSLVRENLSGLGDGALAVFAPAFAIATLTIGVNLLIDSLPGSQERGRSGGGDA